MKQLVVLCGRHCGYCKKARFLIKRALEKEAKFRALDIRFVYEDEEEVKKYTHKLVPAFFCGGELKFEGNPIMQTVISILNDCYEQ